MSRLSGYDSEAVGFDPISRNTRSEVNTSTQTSFMETGTATQTDVAMDCGCGTTAEELNAQDDVLREYPPPGLNEFLRKVVPAMMEQLDQQDKDFMNNSSDSEDDEVLTANMFQELEVKTDIRMGAGDSQPSILGVSWSSAGNSLAVSIGQAQHENWCQHDGLIRIYTVKRSEQDKLVHTLDVTEKNCVTSLQYHPSVSALLAYGTTSGEVVLCNLKLDSVEDGMQLSSPSGCHGSKRVSALHWADPPLANSYLVAQITRTGRRRGAADQVLVSSGSDGTINVWQVNANQKIFETVVTYNVNGSRRMAAPAPDISCFDFIKVGPLRPTEERRKEDIFVVGTKTGRLFLCKTKTEQLSQLNENLDPVYEVLEGHSTCVLDLAFSFQKPGVFASISMDSELRVYDVDQSGPLKVLCLDTPISCMAWLPSSPWLAVLGLSQPARQALQVYDVAGGRRLPVEGLAGPAGVTAVAVGRGGSCRIAAGDSEGVVRIYDLPSRRIRLTAEDLEF